MIICHTHKFVFIRTKKVASSSIEMFLAENFLQKGDIRSNNSIEKRNPFYDHMTANDFIKECPDIWEEYYTFSIVRHPIDRMISEYFYSKVIHKHYDNFSQFIRDDHVRGTLNCDVLKTPNDEKFNYVMMYEFLVDELKTVLNDIGISYNDLLLPYEKSEFRKDRKPWYQFVSASDMKYIRQEFKREIDFHREFGYII